MRARVLCGKFCPVTSNQRVPEYIYFQILFQFKISLVTHVFASVFIGGDTHIVLLFHCVIHKIED